MENMNESKLVCDWLHYDVVNFAMQQNFVPVVRKLAITNTTPEEIRDVRVKLSAEPEFAAVWTKSLDRLPAGQTVDVGAVDLQMSGVFLAGLTERLTGLLTLEISQTGNVLHQETTPMTVLAYDEWAGLAFMPDMVAAFIMPNHPEVLKVIGEAAPLLEKWTGSASFDAYQSRNPNRIRMQAAALYSALQTRRITYCVAPASFEEIGQRVRLPDAVFAHRMGNCLDLSLLYAACLEAVGLHPLIIFTKGHVFTGVWLVQETFSESVQDDVTLLTKRLADGVHEISITESTLLTAAHKSTYEEAELAARSHLAEPESFFGFVDVRRARGSSIRPIPLRLAAAEGWVISDERNERPSEVEAAAPEAMTIINRPVEAASIPMTKQRQWERKLLDLSLRNTLLHFRMTKSAIPLLNTQLGELEDALADGQELQIMPRPSDWVNTERSAELFQSVSRDHPLSQLIREEFLHKRLRADANEKELFEKATHLYRSARLSLEENGANTLYLALGLLKWYESPASELPRHAPIVLVPVELLRKSSSAGFVLRLRDEEPQINITLLEMLRQDFGIDIGGLDPLPRDGKGIDLPGIFAAIRHVIMNMPRWDVVESAVVGLFSFSRFVMWNDIRSRADDLLKNKVVASLMSGRMEWDPGESFPEAGRLDGLYAPRDLPLPISADSSQMTAISAALQDKSFVLHGPPGTGKSQTITNMIASALANGKTVLFVAEKMAALSVVQSRLEQIGLGPFCLELHSNKSTKKAVLEQLRKTLETARTTAPEEWERQADRLAAMRSELNGYALSLHKPYASGFSLYDAIVRYGNVRSAPDAVVFEPALAGAANRVQFESWSELANELRVAGEACGHPFRNPWEDAATSQYTPAMKSQVESLLNAYLSKLTEMKKSYAVVAEWMQHRSVHPDPDELERIGELAQLLQQMPASVPHAWLGAEELETAGEQAVRAARHGRSRNEARSRILEQYSSEALDFDAASALSEWRKAELQWFLPKLLKMNRICKMLRAMTTAGAIPPKAAVAEHLALIIRYQAEAAALRQLEPTAAPLLGPQWNNGEADWEAVTAANAWIQEFNQAYLRLYPDRLQTVRARKHFAELLFAGRAPFMERYASSIADYLANRQELLRLERELAELLAVDFRGMDEKRGADPWFEYREHKLRSWREQTDRLREWCGWRHVRDRTEQAGLSSLVSAYERGELQHAEVIPAFERGWWKALIEYIMREDKQLASFSGRLFEEKIRGFQETIETFETLTRKEIAARLSAKLPPLNNQAASSSEAGILLRAIRSGGRSLSLRKLFEQIPNLLRRICPCMLMSPMSVAQYLDPKDALFDLVVFDEASQLPTSEAVGAMARGRTVIVVGDPKQLPPTSFFASAGSQDTDDSAVPEDLESILDDCLALGMPQEHLLWHYRSRHESLIAFSNRHFYENKLLTFPSPLERLSNVKWHSVEGFYDRGRSKQNRAEAEAVVAEIVRRLRQPELSSQSIGVVTFNSIQQTLIEDLLDEAFRKDSEIEQIAARQSEPIFIKNLENVQGDERDVILFSIGYGPDPTGKVSLNFGPLNREGGWRRLNVAVSRARQEMHVFSALRADHLDVSRTAAHGVSALKAFLEYAEKGVAALHIQNDQLASKSEGVERQIAAALTLEGHHVDLHVGASGYRIDLAIVDPDNPSTYALAIVCDGESYTTGKTARDREVLRANMLKRLGWRLHRVWSPDWLDNPARELQRIQAAFREARRTATDARQDEAVTMDAGGRLEHTSASEAQSIEATAADHTAWRAVYHPLVLPAVDLSSEEFYNTAHSRMIREQMAKIIAEEGPVSRTLLLRKVLQAWDISRAGARVERHFETLLATLNLKTTVWDDTEFYWPNDGDPSLYGVYRVSEKDQERRSAEDLPPEEIANAIHEVLFNQISLPQEDLIKETVKLLGYARTGAALEKAVMNGLQEAAKRGIAVSEQGKVYYRK